MALTRRDLKEQCEQIQENLVCILDGLDEKVIDAVCQVVVDRFDILAKLSEENI